MVGAEGSTELEWVNLHQMLWQKSVALTHQQNFRAANLTSGIFSSTSAPKLIDGGHCDARVTITTQQERFLRVIATTCVTLTCVTLRHTSVTIMAEVLIDGDDEIDSTCVCR